MFKLRILLAALLMVAGLTQQAAAETAAATKLLVFGDSLVAGYGLPAGESFPDALSRALTAEGRDVAVINGGISGDTTAGGAARIDWALTDNPDAVIVVLGGNDALRGLPVADMERNLDAILAAIGERGIPVLFTGMMAPRNMGQDYAAGFDATFPVVFEKAEAREDGVLFYPFFLDGVALVPELNLGDGIHPNLQGIAVITERILPSVRELLDGVAQ